jgi:hypothetical protein
MATRRISQLPLVTGVAGTDSVPLVASGTTKRATLNTLAGYFVNLGPTGPTGAVGVGVTGAAGSVGATGAAGVSIVGPTGPAGGVGATGPSGAAGSVGATGPAGSAGGVGATGPTGVRGPGEIYRQSTPPTAADGSAWLDTDTGRYFVRYAGVWVEIGWQP